MKLPIADYRLQIADCRMESDRATLRRPSASSFCILHFALCTLNSPRARVVMRFKIPTDERLLPGHVACPGCGAALAMRYALERAGREDDDYPAGLLLVHH